MWLLSSSGFRRLWSSPCDLRLEWVVPLWWASPIAPYRSFSTPNRWERKHRSSASLQAIGFPSGRGERNHMVHIRPFSLRPGSIQSIPSSILRSTGRDMLCQLQQETGHREGFDLSLEELVIGGVVDHGGLSVLLDTYLFQRQRRACDVLREDLSCLKGSHWDVNRSIDTESGLSSVYQAACFFSRWR